MKKIEGWENFNEGVAEFRKSHNILTSIVKNIDVTDLFFGDRFEPYVYFKYNNKQFTIILCDRYGLSGNFSNVKIYNAECNSNNDLKKIYKYYTPIEKFKVNQIDDIVKFIKQYGVNVTSAGSF